MLWVAGLEVGIDAQAKRRGRDLPTSAAARGPHGESRILPGEHAVVIRKQRADAKAELYVIKAEL